jgi:PTS system N-acetylgalactosamine-specific IIA component
MFGGMNLPLVITTVIGKDDAETDEVLTDALDGARDQLHEFRIEAEDEEEEL